MSGGGDRADVRLEARAVEAIDTGEDAIVLIAGGDHDNMPTKRITKEGKTINTNGSINPNTRLNGYGEGVPLVNITKKNAPCD